jgi:hypothetical protein
MSEILSDDVQVAHVDRDREIICRLIEAAASCACIDVEHPATDERHRDVRDQAAAFLKAWWGRKMPPLDMPRMG